MLWRGRMAEEDGSVCLKPLASVDEVANTFFGCGSTNIVEGFPEMDPGFLKSLGPEQRFGEKQLSPRVERRE